MFKLNKSYKGVEKYHPGFTARCRAVIDAALVPDELGCGEKPSPEGVITGPYGSSPEEVLHSRGDRIFVFQAAGEAAQKLTFEDCVAFAELNLLESGYDPYNGRIDFALIRSSDRFYYRVFGMIKDLAKEALVDIPTMRAKLAFAIAHTMKLDLIQDATEIGLLPMNSWEATKVAPDGGTVLPVTGPKGEPSNYPLW